MKILYNFKKIAILYLMLSAISCEKKEAVVKDSIEKGEKKAKKKACDTAGYTQTVADMASTLFPPSRPLCVGVDVYSRLVKGVVCEK